MKLFLTIDEAAEIIRDHLHLLPSIEIVFDDNHLHKDVASEFDDRIDVPSDWSKSYPPDAAVVFPIILVKLRNGQVLAGAPNYWDSQWSQDNYSLDIVKFRGI